MGELRDIFPDREKHPPEPDGALGDRKPGTEVTHYADRAMFEAEDFADTMPKVYLLSATPDPLGSVAAMSMMYEGKVVRDLADVTDEQRRHYWEESFKTHLKAPWESIDLHFLVEGVTRAFTHQMVRQRTAVFAQESMRFAVKEKIAARPGPLLGQDEMMKEVWDDTMESVWAAYQHMIANGIPAEEARGILPHDTLTRLHYKTNLRNLADHLGNRLCTQAQFEWRLVASQLRGAIRDYGYRMMTGMTAADAGWQFELIAQSEIFQPVCYAMGRCPFNADFDRGCTIRERVDAGQFELIRVEEWLADPKAGWVR
jgi:flavin-dependent thymidylate synthase